MLNIGENIVFLRYLKKLTQEELAERINLSPQLIAEFEDRIKQPDVEILVKLAECTNVDIRHLIYGFPTPQEQKTKKADFVALTIITAALWCSILLLQDFVKEWVTRTFDIGPQILYSTLIKPTFFLMLGITIVAGAKLFLDLKPLNGKHIHKLHIALGLLTLTYFIFAIPPNCAALGDTVFLFMATKGDICFPTPPMPSWLKAWEQNFMIRAYRLYPFFGSIFTILGISLGLTKTKKYNLDIKLFNKKPQF
ncbi:helix-turn-helix domain-containing protein [Anaerotignum sp.]|uniref:helix-turn-helix domain-containing protein n=1 Tax=Anaerotignum sp. TaxID=2039241 RepID=UPI0028ACD684|nr:helix-turn-helix transcriptional regulator [Anaerotignum sp.]